MIKGIRSKVVRKGIPIVNIVNKKRPRGNQVSKVIVPKENLY